jgi:hypothetical protein
MGVLSLLAAALYYHPVLTFAAGIALGALAWAATRQRTSRARDKK